ncbi:MAG: hypothetical protein DI629_06215 [Mesorhizobium amorphae]|nr:MAG: hypothetical protein DI629_06215 [Mesorhizobium amorphae]
MNPWGRAFGLSLLLHVGLGGLLLLLPAHAPARPASTRILIGTDVSPPSERLAVPATVAVAAAPAPVETPGALAPLEASSATAPAAEAAAALDPLGPGVEVSAASDAATVAATTVEEAIALGSAEQAQPLAPTAVLSATVEAQSSVGEALAPTGSAVLAPLADGAASPAIGPASEEALAAPSVAPAGVPALAVSDTASLEAAGRGSGRTVAPVQPEAGGTVATVGTARGVAPSAVGPETPSVVVPLPQAAARTGTAAPAARAVPVARAPSPAAPRARAPGGAASTIPARPQALASRAAPMAQATPAPVLAPQTRPATAARRPEPEAVLGPAGGTDPEAHARLVRAVSTQRGAACFLAQPASPEEGLLVASFGQTTDGLESFRRRMEAAVGGVEVQGNRVAQQQCAGLRFASLLGNTGGLAVRVARPVVGANVAQTGSVSGVGLPVLTLLAIDGAGRVERVAGVEARNGRAEFRLELAEAQPVLLLALASSVSLHTVPGADGEPAERYFGLLQTEIAARRARVDWGVAAFRVE